MAEQLWVVWHPDGGEDGPEHGRHYRAADASLAAEAWAKHFDQDDYDLSANEDHREIVKVAMVANDPIIRTFKVRAVISVDYYADAVDPVPSAEVSN
jgi:hypothetical protein